MEWTLACMACRLAQISANSLDPQENKDQSTDLPTATAITEAPPERFHSGGYKSKWESSSNVQSQELAVRVGPLLRAPVLLSLTETGCQEQDGREETGGAVQGPKRMHWFSGKTVAGEKPALQSSRRQLRL